MNDLYILIGLVIFAFLMLFIKHIIEIFLDNRKFNKQLSYLFEKHNKRYNDAFKKSLEESLPLIIELIEKKRKLKNNLKN